MKGLECLINPYTLGIGLPLIVIGVGYLLKNGRSSKVTILPPGTPLPDEYIEVTPLNGTGPYRDRTFQVDQNGTRIRHSRN